MGKKKKKASRRRVSGRQVSGQGAVAATGAGTARQQSGADTAGIGDKLRLIGTYFLPGLLIFLILTPPIVGPYGQKGGYTPDLHMAAYIQVGALVVLSLFLLSTFFRRKIEVAHSPVLLPLLLFYGWAMLSVLWADTKYEAIVDALDWSGAFLCAFLVMLLLRNLKMLSTLMFFVLVSGLLMALLGIGQYLLGIDWVQQHIVPAATFSNKNMAGQYGVLTLPIAAAFFLHSRSKLNIWFFAVVIALIMTYIFYTRSRGAWVGFIVEATVLAGLVAYLKYKHGYRLFGDMPVKKIALASSLALFAGMSYLTPSMLGNEDKVMEASIGSKSPSLLAEDGGETLKKVANFSGSANTRTTMWMNSVPMFRDHFLIGVGLGNWTIHYATYQSWFKPDRLLMKNQYHANAHNDYVEILCEFGIIGFALFVWVVVSLFRVMGRLLSNHDEEYFLLTIPLIAAIMGLAVNAVFSFPLKQPVPIFMIMVYVAVLSNLYAAAAGTGGRHRVLSMPPMPVRALAAGVVVLATAGLFEMHRDWYNSELHYRSAVVYLKQGKARNAYVQARRAYELNPLRTGLLWIEATALMQTGRDESYGTVVELLEKVDRARPYSSSTLLNLATAYSRSGRHDDAAEAMGRLASVQPINTDIRRKHGILLYNAGRNEETLKELEVVRSRYRRRGDLKKNEKARSQLAQVEQLIQIVKKRIEEKEEGKEEEKG